MTLHLDHLYFVADPYEGETAFYADGDFAGEIAFDEVWQHFNARKIFAGELTPWRPMRRLTEARAFIVSRRQTPVSTASFPRGQSAPQAAATIPKELAPLSDISTGVA